MKSVISNAVFHLGRGSVGIRGFAESAPAWGRFISLLKLGATAVPVGVMVVMALLSDGVLQDDDLTHFTMARWAWAYPMYLADDWGRPGFTVPYALVANLGPPGVAFALCRLATVAVVAVAAWLTWRVAAGIVGGRHAWVAPAALVTMPLYFQLGYTTLTETTASLYAILGTFWLLRDRTRLAAVAFSLVPLTRHEGVLLLPVAALLLAWRRDWVALPLLLAGELAWNVGKPLLGYPLNELPIFRFWPKGEPGHLGSGDALHYVSASFRAYGPVAAALWVVGAAVLARGRAGVTSAPERAAALTCAAGAAGLLLVQTYLYAVNTHESGGYARFLLPAAPWVAVCVAAAAGRVLDAGRRGRAAASLAVLAVAGLAVLGLARNGWSIWWGLVPLAAPVAVLLPASARWSLAAAAAAVVAAWVPAVRPHRLLPHQRLVIETTLDLRSCHPGRPLAADNPWADYVQDAPRHPYYWAANEWRKPPAGGLIYLWDRDHSAVNLPLIELRSYPHRELPSPGPYLRVFERLP